MRSNCGNWFNQSLFSKKFILIRIVNVIRNRSPNARLFTSKQNAIAENKIRSKMRSTETYKNKQIFALYFRFTCLLNRTHQTHFALVCLFLFSLFSFLTFSVTISGRPLFLPHVYSQFRKICRQSVAMVQREGTALLCECKRKIKSESKMRNYDCSVDGSREKCLCGCV